MEIITNNQNRPFLYGYEIPEAVLNSDFDWLENDEKTDGFIKYRGRFYHVSEFMAIIPAGSDISPSRGHYDHENSLKDWHGIHTDSAFSGVLIRASSDGESYQIATFIS